MIVLSHKDIWETVIDLKSEIATMSVQQALNIAIQTENVTEYRYDNNSFYYNLFDCVD